MGVSSLRQRRGELLALSDVGGIEFCRAYAAEADAWIRSIAVAAGGEHPKKVALLAVGGYGRGELSPYSDLDLLLLHDQGKKISTLADAIWYPIWDEGVALDHSVRKPKEVFAVGSEDLRVALGLLDARVVWGDPSIADPLIARVRALWSTSWGDHWLPELESQMTIRHEQHGDLADLLEPDLKEAHGGLRDVNVLAAVRWAFPEVEATTDFDEVFRARDVLLDARVALHAVTGRALDRLLLQEQDQVSARTGVGDADELMQRVSAAARIVARTSDTAWRRRGHWRQRGGASPEPPARLDEGIELYDGEVRLAAGAPVTTDVTLTLRLAAAAAAADRPIALESLVRLASEAPEVPVPWPTGLLAAFVSLLGSGPGLVPAVEALDAHDLFSRHFPEWRWVRSYHQRNAYHRFTVDRHLLEAVLHARAALSDVSRPDLLLLGALLHDIGKGHAGDHTDVGIELVQGIGPRMGLGDDDTATLVQLVRHHLLLADVATRRDLDDPATVRYVAAAVGDESTLELLHALSRADGLATGPSAWGSWKSHLVDVLNERTRRALQGHDLVIESRPDHDLLDDVASDGVVVRREGDWLIVATADQPGLLATITASLALLAIDIRSADLLSHDDIAIDRFFCAPGPRGWPDDDTLAEAIRVGLANRDDLHKRLGQRAASYAPRRSSAKPVVPVAHALPAASEVASVIEVIAVDEVGLLSRLSHVVAEAGFDISAARLSTVGEVAIDTFYVRGPGGRKLNGDEMTTLLGGLSDAIGAQGAVA